MNKQFLAIIRSILASSSDKDSLCDFDAAAQFERDGDSPTDILRRLNAAFLISLAGDGCACHEEAKRFLDEHDDDRFAMFLRKGLKQIDAEIVSVAEEINEAAEVCLDLSPDHQQVR